MIAALLLIALLLALPALVERTRRTGRAPYLTIELDARLAALQLLDADQAVDAPAAAKAAALAALPNRAARRARERIGKLNVRQAAKCEAYAQRAANRYGKLAGETPGA